LKGEAAIAARDRAVGHTGLASVMDRTIETLSKGFRRRVGLAQAILHDPDVLILDEPPTASIPTRKRGTGTDPQHRGAQDHRDLHPYAGGSGSDVQPRRHHQSRHGGADGAPASLPPAPPAEDWTICSVP